MVVTTSYLLLQGRPGKQMSSVKKKKSGPIENDNKLHVSTAYIALWHGTVAMEKWT